MKKRAPPTSVQQYIDGFPPEVRTLLEQLRDAIRAAAPEATERISYHMPTFYLNGNLVHFAAYANHIGFYPTSSGVSAFAERLGDFVTSKGTIQFPLDQPLPLELVREIVEFRVEENMRTTNR